MRFGAFVPQGWRHDLVEIPVERHWETMTRVAQAIESSGYESLWVYDHFHTVPQPSQNATYEAWALMAALATVTDTVRLGQMCTCNTYRPPSYLAKVAASIDVISGGRLEMGIGAGWYQHEHAGYGYPFLRPAARIGMLREGVEIMRAMWTQDEVHYDGEYYTLEGAICRPHPLQDPHIPLWVAGGGEQLTLNIAARHAQYTNFGDTVDEFTHKSRILERHCSEVGRDPGEIVRTSNFNILCAATEREVADRIGWYRSILARHLPEAGVARMVGFFQATSGTPDQVASMLQDWKEAGLDYAIVNFADAGYDTSGLELFAAQVIPALSG